MLFALATSHFRFASSAYQIRRKEILFFIETFPQASGTMPQAQPELKKVCAPQDMLVRLTDAKIPQYLDKRVEVQLNGSRKVMGTLRGYDVSLRINQYLRTASVLIHIFAGLLKYCPRRSDGKQTQQREGPARDVRYTG